MAFLRFKQGSPYTSASFDRKWYPQHLTKLFWDPDPGHSIGPGPYLSGSDFLYEVGGMGIGKYFTYFFLIILGFNFFMPAEWMTGLYEGTAWTVGVPIAWTLSLLLPLASYGIWISGSLLAIAIPIAIYWDIKNYQSFCQVRAECAEEVARMKTSAQ